MDRILAEDGDLALDGSSDLPSLPLLLLPIPTQRVLSPEPVVAPPAGASPDFSREGPFDPSPGTSVSGAAPLVLDSFAGMSVPDDFLRWRSGDECRSGPRAPAT